MKVLGLASYPIEAAATRYRLVQYVAPLRERGIELEVRSFLDSRLFASLYRRGELPRTAAGLLRASLARLADAAAARRADVVLVQREAMMFGPPVVEFLATRLGGRPLVLDLDDATYVSYTSPTYGRLASALKWFRKTDDLIRWARVVTCGSRAIREYVEAKGARAVYIPTVVDTDQFRPLEQDAESTTGARGASAGATETKNSTPVVGWIGTHSTFQYLESIFPALRELAKSHRFKLKLVGAGRDAVSLQGVEVENLPWKLEREIADFQSFDVGLYPIVPSEWAAGKSGFKSVQYMAVGVPFVASPVGATAEIGEPNVTHFLATGEEEWRAALGRLLADASLRRRMGAAGRTHALANYNVPAQADKLARALGEAAGGSGNAATRLSGDAERGRGAGARDGD
jgi:glycosyltransferase involved in cell wall biosynthesis